MDKNLLVQAKFGIWKKKGGEFTAYMMMFLVVFVFMLFSVCLFKRNIALVTVREAEDSLKAATLAGAVIDLKEYGLTGTIVISDYTASYNNFKESLINSMGLGYDFSPPSTSIITSTIKINDYIIYNVRGNVVECIAYADGNLIPTITTGTVGNIITPNNVMITESTVYSSITFHIEGFIKNKSMLGQLFNMDDIVVTKESCADITTR